MSTQQHQIGQFIESEAGYFGGIILVNGHPQGVIWAPKAEGETNAAWLNAHTNVPGAQSWNDSIANTVALAEADSPLATWATGLRIGGHADWAIPARDALELAYRHFKPTTEETGCYFRDGENPSSVPPAHHYTAAHHQTAVAVFKADAAEAFEDAAYWSSTQYSDNSAWYQYFGSGGQFSSIKSAERRARAVRLIPMNP